MWGPLITRMMENENAEKLDDADVLGGLCVGSSPISLERCGKSKGQEDGELHGNCIGTGEEPKARIGLGVDDAKLQGHDVGNYPMLFM